MSSTYTNNLGLRKPANKDPVTFDAWDVSINGNMDSVDTAFGNRNYAEQNYISNADSHTASIDKLDMGLKDAADLAPTSDQQDALTGEGTPSVTNKYVTKSYVRMARKEILFPEFQSATFALSGSGTNVGLLSTNSEASGNYIYNYYKWVNTTEVAFQDYDISIQWRVPETFLSWHPTEALIVDICTQEADLTNNKVKVFLSEDGSGVAQTSSGEICSNVAATWNSEREGTELIYFTDGDTNLANIATDAAAGTFDTLNIVIRMYSKASKYVKIGAITLQYIG